MQVRTSELTEAALDFAVKRALGGMWLLATKPFNPSTDWAQGGPIIERDGIQLAKIGNVWEAWIDEGPFCKGPTPLIAAMRCYIASKLGDSIEIPNHLTTGELA